MNDIDSLLQGESVNIEYKVALPQNSEKYIKTVIAFSNTNGGTIIFGIDDQKREVVGIDDENIFKIMDAITNTIEDTCVPKIFPNISIRNIKDKSVIVVEIPQGHLRPYFIKSKGIQNGTYLRVAGTTRLAENYTIKDLILEGEHKCYDSQLSRHTPLSTAEINEFCVYLKNIALKYSITTSEKNSVKDLNANKLESWGVIINKNGEYYPTIAYDLISGKSKDQPSVQCAVFKGTTRGFFIDKKEFSGPLESQVDNTMKFLMQKLNCTMKLVGMHRVDVYELPLDSLREIIANAVVHRSYLEPGNIQVAIFDDRVEITSPGSLLLGLNIPKIKEGFSKLRNRTIGNVFFYLKIIEKWGCGVPKVITQCKEYGLKTPDFTDCDGDFRVNIYRSEAIKASNTSESKNIFNTNFSNLSDDTNDTKNVDDTNCSSLAHDTNDTKNVDDTNRSSLAHDTNDTKNVADTNRSSLAHDTNDTKNVDDTNRSSLDDNNQPKKENLNAKIISLIRTNPEITQKEICNSLNLSLITIKRLMQSLQSNGVITRKGSKRRGKWVINILE